MSSTGRKLCSNEDCGPDYGRDVMTGLTPDDPDVPSSRNCKRRGGPKNRNSPRRCRLSPLRSLSSAHRFNSEAPARVVDGLKHLSAPACRFSTASTTPQPHRASQYTQSGTRGDGTVCMLPEQSPRAAMVKSPDFAGVGCPARLSRARRLPPACSVPCLFLRTSPPWDVPGFP